MKQPWFKIHKSSWGWYPSNLWGCLTVLAMIIGVGAVTSYFASCQTNNIQAILFNSFPFNSLIISLTILVALLTGERPVFGQENQKKERYNRDWPRAYFFLALIFIPLLIIYLLAKNYFSSLAFLLVFLNFLFIYRKLVKN